MNQVNNFARCILVSYCKPENGEACLIVGEQKKDKMDILNAFQGADATRLYNELITQKGVNDG